MLQHRKIALSIMLLAICVMASGIQTARADVVLSNLTAVRTSGYGANTQYTLASGFTVAAGQDYALNSVTFLMRNAVGGSYTVSVWLYSDVGGNPGSALASLGSFPITSSVYIDHAVSGGNFLLKAGQTYWVVMNSDYPGSGAIFWGYSATAPSGLFGYVGNRENNSGGGWADSGRHFMLAVDASIPVSNVAGVVSRFNPGDRRVDPQPGDRIAVYCDSAEVIRVIGIGPDGHGAGEAIFDAAKVLAAGLPGKSTRLVSFVDKKVDLGVVSIQMAPADDGKTYFYVAWNGGILNASGLGDFKKMFAAPIEYCEYFGN